MIYRKSFSFICISMHVLWDVYLEDWNSQFVFSSYAITLTFGNCNIMSYLNNWFWSRNIKTGVATEMWLTNANELMGRELGPKIKKNQCSVHKFKQYPLDKYRWNNIWTNVVFLLVNFKNRFWKDIIQTSCSV